MKPLVMWKLKGSVPSTQWRRHTIEICKWICDPVNVIHWDHWNQHVCTRSNSTTEWLHASTHLLSFFKKSANVAQQMASCTAIHIPSKSTYNKQSTRLSVNVRDFWNIETAAMANQPTGDISNQNWMVNEPCWITNEIIESSSWLGKCPSWQRHFCLLIKMIDYDYDWHQDIWFDCSPPGGINTSFHCHGGLVALPQIALTGHSIHHWI